MRTAPAVTEGDIEARITFLRNHTQAYSRQRWLIGLNLQESRWKRLWVNGLAMVVRAVAVCEEVPDSGDPVTDRTVPINGDVVS